jgi:hypothetical protein
MFMNELASRPIEKAAAIGVGETAALLLRPFWEKTARCLEHSEGRRDGWGVGRSATPDRSWTKSSITLVTSITRRENISKNSQLEIGPT